MSIKVMTLVWDGFPGAGSELLAMLALADWCDDRGGSLYPSIKAVGDKIRVGENHARKILRKFEQDRFLAVVGNHFGGKPGTTREYRLNIVKLKSLADEANAKKEAEKAAKYGAKKAGDDQWEDVFATAPLQDTPIPQDGPTAPLQHRDGPPVAPQTPPLQVGLSTIDPPMEPPVLSSASLPPCPHESLIDLYAKNLAALPQPRKSLWRSGKNEAAMRARWRWVMTERYETGERAGTRMATTAAEGLAWFDRYFTYVSKSDFLTGRNDKFSACDLGWLVKADNFAKVLSGNYDNRVAA